MIAQVVGHAFQLAYIDFLRENGVSDASLINHLDYDEVVRQQQIYCDELSTFCDKDKNKEVIYEKFIFSNNSNLLDWFIEFLSKQAIMIIFSNFGVCLCLTSYG